MGINTIHQRGAPILGPIVNGVPIDNPYYYTTYYYASYYHRPLTPDQSVYPDAKRQADADAQNLAQSQANGQATAATVSVVPSAGSPASPTDTAPTAKPSDRS